MRVNITSVCGAGRGEQSSLAQVAQMYTTRPQTKPQTLCNAHARRHGAEQRGAGAGPPPAADRGLGRRSLRGRGRRDWDKGCARAPRTGWRQAGRSGKGPDDDGDGDGDGDHHCLHARTAPLLRLGRVPKQGRGGCHRSEQREMTGLEPQPPSSQLPTTTALHSPLLTTPARTPPQRTTTSPWPG